MLTLLTAKNDKQCVKAKAFLDSIGIVYTERDIIADHPGFDELQRWSELSGISAFGFFRSGGFLLGGLAVAERMAMMNEQSRLAYIAATGKLVRRPILAGESFVLVGFEENNWTQKLSIMKNEQ